MVFNILTKDGIRNGKYSLNRVIAFSGFVVMSAAFIRASVEGKISAEMFLTYPMGLLLLYTPRLAIILLKIWKGKTDGQ